MNKININQNLPNWQQGEFSTTFYLERIEKMETWLAENKKNILENKNNESQEPDEVIGFVDL